MENNIEINPNKKEEKDGEQEVLKKIDRVFRSNYFRKTVIFLLIFIILAVTFGLGAMVGYRKANFSYQWGENYHKNFGGPREGFMGRLMPGPIPGMMGDDFINPHGLAGSIIKIDGANIIVKGNDNVERTILLSGQTTIRNGRQDIKIGDLKVGDLIVTIGDPNSSGQIEAKLIRIFNIQ